MLKLPRRSALSRTRAQRTLFWTAMLFFVSGLFHFGVWLVAGMPTLEGPVTWRKPMTFGVSSGLLSLSLAWVVGLLPQTSRLLRQTRWFSALLVVEVALIDMQQWRGVASHFNRATAFDGAIFTTMGVLISLVSVIILWWTRDLFRHALPTSKTYAFAARAGMVMLNVGNLIGMLIATTEATSLKPVHGATLHVIQVLPVLLWVGYRLRYSRAWPIVSRPSHSSPLLRWRHQ